MKLHLTSKLAALFVGAALFAPLSAAADITIGFIGPGDRAGFSLWHSG